MNRMSRLALASVLLCGAAAAPAFAQDLRQVTIVQSHQSIGVGEEVFIYAVPKLLGYFEEEGIDALSQTAKNGVQVGQMLTTNNAEFGTIGTDTLLISEEQGGNLKAFYHLKQHNGSMIGTLAGSDIKSFEDMKGRTIGVSSVGYGGHMFLKYELDSRGITPDQYTVVATGAGPAAAAALSDGTVEALSLWDAMFATMENGGLDLDYIQYPLMNDIAGLNLVTTDKIIEEDPELAIGVCRAVAKGLHFTLTNPEAALKIFYEVFPTVKPADISVEDAVKTDVRILNAWLEYAQKGVTYGEPTGEFTPERFVNYQNYLETLGNLQPGVDPTQVYTTDLVDDCNDFDRAAIEAQAKAYN